MPSPIQHPTYHKKTMIVGLLLGAILMTNGWILAGSSTKTWFKDISTYLNYSMLTLGILTVSWFIYRIFFAIPRCPQCNSNKLTYIGKHEEFDYPAGMNMKKRQNWTPNRSRHFKCDACEDEYLVPLISQEN